MKKLDIFIFIDALGWDIIKGRDFLEELLPYRKSVKMQFGYSSTAIPTILTGEPPTVHKHLSFYYYAPDKSPFKFFNSFLFKLLPSAFFDRGRVRHILSKIIARFYGFTGYFEMYAMPFDKLHYFDYIEKTDIFVCNGLQPTPNIADELEKRDIPYHISNWRLSEKENFESLSRDIVKGKIQFAFLYTAAMDGLLHKETKEGPSIGRKLDWYKKNIEELVKEVKNHYDDFSLHIISDHGMTTNIKTLDLMSVIEKLPFEFGKDYVAVYDSTMARFWFFNDNAKEQIILSLREFSDSHILDDDEKKKYGIDFSDNMYGETILLMDPGVQIEPCHMGKKALPAMHGYAPEHKDSYA
ncbi:MAG: alkaline phosphatase family protein, partial [Verrucomicrobiota bacterium]|nr:alkaline phosphatase family protein [Verrucomicrobiota bacterium]